MSYWSTFRHKFFLHFKNFLTHYCFFHFYFYLLCIAHAKAFIYRPGNNLLVFVLSYYVDYKNQIRVFSLGRMHFYRLSHLVKNLFLVFNIYILQTIDISPNYLHYCYYFPIILIWLFIYKCGLDTSRQWKNVGK